MSAAVSGPSEIRISVVVPCWNDALALERLLISMRTIRGIDEIIVADASSDEHREAVKAVCVAGVSLVWCTRPNRGAQMNAGAGVATGDVLLFQHCDSTLCQDHLDALREAMRDEALVGGAFHRLFDERHKTLRGLECVGRWYHQYGGVLFGDQSVFVRRAVFERMGGFKEFPLMEDVDFSCRLRRMGPLRVLDPPLGTSARRHLRRGSWRTSIHNGWLLLLFRLGVSPVRLHQMYYRGRSEGDSAHKRLSPPAQIP